MNDFLVSIANIFIDDVLTWTDEIHLGVVGGAGLHALGGCSVWNPNLGIIACAGEDFRPWLADLHARGIDTQGIQFSQERTVRAWQVFQPGDIRVEVLRDPKMKIGQAIPKFEQLEPKYRDAAGYHLLWNGSDQDLFALLEELKDINPKASLVYEPSPEDCQKRLDFFERLFKYVDCFSPSGSEGQRILKIDHPETIIDEFIGMGCKMVALRLGSEGSMAGTSQGKTYHVPAAEAWVVDVTGAGNAYVGGLLCGLSRHSPIEETLAMASVSASFEIEQYGLCKFSDDKMPIRDARFLQVLENITSMG
jgi:sugar/nucleoside kinase (ribokinase family)